MNSSVAKSKSDLRQKIRTALQKMTVEKRQLDSQKLCMELKRQSFFRSAMSILFFASLPDEPDLWPVLKEALADGKTVALPCFDAENRRYRPRRVKNLHVELVSGRFGIREPGPACVEMPLADLDVVLVPGIAFDRHGDRLGRGRGFYDQWLEGFNGKKIGIAFDEQLVDAVPAGARDARMDFILTPTRCVKCNE